MEERLLSIRKVAALLDISEKTVRRLVEIGHLPQPLPVAGRLQRWPETVVRGYQYALAMGLLPPPKNPRQEKK